MESLETSESGDIIVSFKNRAGAEQVFDGFSVG